MINYQQNKKFIILLFVILALAGFFRVWQLDSIPPGIYPDEAINANQAIEEPGKIFYPENNGREGFYMNLIAMSFSVFGISIWSFKIVSAIIGILTVLGLYLLVLELFKNNKLSLINNKLSLIKYQFIALASCFFLATSFWHINFSRIGFRAILVPLILVFSFYFLFRGFREKKIYNFLFAGLIFGLGFHTYIAFRVAVLLILAVLFFYWLVSLKQKSQKQFFIFASCFLLFVFIAALPIGIYFLQNPADFMGRAGDVSIFTQTSPIKTLGQSFISHLAMFNFVGDYNWRHNISSSPVLFWPVGILFLIGFILSLATSFKNLLKRKLSLPYCFLILWFFVMLLPGFLSSEGAPHCLRCIGAIPAVFIFAGIGAEFLYSRLKNLLPDKTAKTKLLIIFAGMLLLFSFTYAQYHRYFNLWAKNTETQHAFAKNYVKIGKYLNSLPFNTQKYVIVNQGGVLVDGIPMPAQTIMFIENTKIYSVRTEMRIPSTIYLLPENINQIQTEKNTIIVPMEYDENLSNQLKEMFPNGVIEEQQGVWRYKINF